MCMEMLLEERNRCSLERFLQVRTHFIACIYREKCAYFIMYMSLCMSRINVWTILRIVIVGLNIVQLEVTPSLKFVISYLQ